MAPVLARIDDRQRMHIMDIGLLRISVIDLGASGTEPQLIRTISVARVVRAVSGFERLANGDYLLAAAGGSRKHTVFLLDSAGTLKDNFVESYGFRRTPSTPETEPIWQSITRQKVASDGVNAYATLSTFDSLWTVDLGKKRVTSAQIPSLSYRVPQLPTPLPD